MSVSVCSFVCPRAYLQNCTPIFTNGSVLLWRRCDKLRTSGFMDDVVLSTVSHVEACRYRCGEQRRCVIARTLTPLLRRTGCVMSQTTAGATLDESIVQGVPGAEPATLL